MMHAWAQANKFALLGAYLTVALMAGLTPCVPQRKDQGLYHVAPRDPLSINDIAAPIGQKSIRTTPNSESRAGTKSKAERSQKALPPLLKPGGKCPLLAESCPCTAQRGVCF